jgi:DNA topoisomerase-6 subunit A
MSTAKVSKKIKDEASRVKTSILGGNKPSMKFPLRALTNVKYQPKVGYLEMKGRMKERTLTVNTVKTFAQTLRMMALSKQLVDTDDIATKREAYYVSKNWDDARFDEQPESDTVMDDVEALFGLNREQLGFIPEEKGGEIAGKLFIIDKDRDTGKPLRIDCTKFGSGAYSIPVSVEELEFETDAKFILVIETAGMFQRLVKHNYWKTANCILVSMGGVPTRACRRFIRRLSDEKQIPVYVFVDGDPYGISNIYRTLKVGSGNAAHLNEFFCVPKRASSASLRKTSCSTNFRHIPLRKSTSSAPKTPSRPTPSSSTTKPGRTPSTNSSAWASAPNNRLWPNTDSTT